MADKISFIETDKINEKLQIIMRQTDYTEETAMQKLNEFNYDHLQVIRDFLGIAEKKAPVITSINQEIYKQLREKMNTGIKDYNSKVQNEKVVLH